MDGYTLTTEQRAALAWLYAAAEQNPRSRSFACRRFGGEIWARHEDVVGGPEYRMPDDMLARLVALGLAERMTGDRFVLHSGWSGWVDIRDAFPPSPVSTAVDTATLTAVSHLSSIFLESGVVG